MDGRIVEGFNLTRRTIEPAGAHFETLLKKYRKQIATYEGGIAQYSSENEEDSSEEQNNQEGDLGKKVNVEELKKKRLKRTDESEDLYEILGLTGQEQDEITESQIKKSYKDLAVLFHPDKYKDREYNQQAKDRWLKVD